MDLEDRKKQQADKFLADHIQRVENDKVQLKQLENYLAEYQAQYQETCKHGISVQTLTTYQAFMAKVSNVIDQHKNSMKYNIEQLAGVRQYWMKIYARRNAVGSLIGKIKADEQAADDKALQKLIDEASTLSVSRKKTNF
jgi:flagellar FliJ protein